MTPIDCDLPRMGITSDLVSSAGLPTFPHYPVSALLEMRGLISTIIDVERGHDPAHLADLDLLVSVPHGAPLDGRALSEAGRLAAVIRVGVGFEDCDADALTANGTALVLPTSATRRPTAVAALTLILALATRLLDKHRITLGGPARWHERAVHQGHELRGKLLGLVGCGAIGRELIAIARPLGLRLAIHDPAVNKTLAASLGAESLSLGDLLQRSDIVSLHCPLTRATRHLIDARHLALMKPSALLVNTARGGIIDQDALVRALAEGRLGGAGLDVFEPEPLPLGHPLLTLPNVLLAAHALNWTRELDVDLGRANAEAVSILLTGGIPDGVANPSVARSQAFRDKLARMAAMAESAGHSA